MSIETFFDIPLIAGLALREKRIQQNYRPIIVAHKWFARRQALYSVVWFSPSSATVL